MVLASAQAASVHFTVTGLTQAQSAIVLSDGGSGVHEVSCQDNGQPPDKAPDGVWTCKELQVEGAELWAALATDAGVFRVGSIPINAPRLRVELEKTGSGVRVELDPQEKEHASDGPPAGPGMVLLTRLYSAAAQGAPMLLIKVGNQAAEHPCRDDGTLFDDKLNDGYFICSGFLPGPASAGEFAVTFALREPDGENRDIVTLKMTGGAGIRFANIDISQTNPPSTLPFALQVLPKRASKAMSGGQAVVGPPSQGPMLRPPPPPPPESGPWKILSLALGAILGIVFLSRRRTYRVPPMLEPVGTPRLGRVGPRPEGVPIALEVSDPVAVLPGLVAHLSGHRRLVLVGVSALPPALDVGHAVYTVRSAAMADVLDAVGGLVRSPGPPVAVILFNPVELHSDASVSPVPLVEFYEELDGLAWSLSLVAPDEEIRGGADRWALLEDGGWRRLDR